MAGTFELKEDEVNKTVEDYKSVNIGDVQQTIIDEFAQILNDAVGIPENVLKGFMYITVSNWQLKTKGRLKDVEGKDPEKRIAIVDELAKHFKVLVKPLLKDPAQWDDLDEGITKGFNHYVDKWSHRE